MEEEYAVEQFMEMNVSKFPVTPNPKQDVYINALRDCLARLPERVIAELGRNTVVYVPGDTPMVIHGFLLPLNSVIVLTNSMRRWTRDAKVGVIALSFAQVLSREKDREAIVALARDWGFEKEVEAALRKKDPGD